MTGRPNLAGVLGHPIGHSLSPVIHRYWADLEGINAHYIAVDAGDTEASFRRVVNGLRDARFNGVNVTLPHKENAFRLATIHSRAAEAIGAANMLTLSGDEIEADNSDWQGFLSAIEPILGSTLNDPGTAISAMVIGAGGAARAICFALGEVHAKVETRICNRTLGRAQRLAKEFGGEAAPWADLYALAGQADLIVNTTSLGMTGEPALDLEARFKPGAMVCDIVYSPLETPLLATARAQGVKTLDGLDMLIHQAVPGYLAWLGSNAPVGLGADTGLRNKLETILMKRSVS